MVDATRCFFFGGYMVASRGGYRMARGRHYAKLSLSNAARLSFYDLCILLFMFLSLCRLCVCVFLCSHWSLVDVPLIFFCPADHVPDWQPRVLLGMVEARSVNVKKTTTTTCTTIRTANVGFVYVRIIWPGGRQYAGGAATQQQLCCCCCVLRLLLLLCITTIIGPINYSIMYY